MKGGHTAAEWVDFLISNCLFYIFIQVYLCQKLSLVNEMYFAITLDRKTAGPVSFLFQYVIFNLLYLLSVKLL